MVKTFKEWLSEMAYHSHDPKAGADIYKNPSMKEMMQLIRHPTNRHGEVKGLLHGDDIYCWHPNHGYHDQIRRHLGHKPGSHEDSVGIYLGHEKADGKPHKFFAYDGAEYDVNIDHKYAENHPFIKKHGYKSFND